MTAVSSPAVHRVVTGPLMQNCYVVSADSGDAVVIDPGGEAARIIDHIATSRLHLQAVLATHGHPDHISALAELVEAYNVPFGIHSDESDALRRVNFYRFALHDLGPVEIPPIDLDLAEVTALRFGALAIDVVHTPGHTPGSVCLETGEELFTGDSLLADDVGRADLPGGDREALEASLAMLGGRYPPTTVLRPGHGEPATLGDALASAAAAGAP